MPPFYIGSTSIKKIETGYRGSVNSIEYKKLWKTELKKNPHLFSVEVISTHSTRQEAFQEEYRLQIENDAIRSPWFSNKAYACENGFFGSGLPHTEETRRKMSEGRVGSGNSMYGRKQSEETRKKISESRKNHCMNETQKEKISEAGKALWSDPEWRQKRKPSSFKPTEEWKKQHGETLRSKPDITCPHCQKIGRGAGMHRFHLDKCKHKPTAFPR